MKKFIKEVREGYFFSLVKLRGLEAAKDHVKEGFRFVFLGYYAAIIALIVVLLTVDNHLKVKLGFFAKLLLALDSKTKYNKWGRKNSFDVLVRGRII